MRFKIEWDNGFDDGETIIEAETPWQAEVKFESEYPDRTVLGSPEPVEN